MISYKRWEIGDLIKIVDNKNFGIVLKTHQKADIPFYLIYDAKTQKQSWYPYYSISEAKINAIEETYVEQTA